MSAEFNAHCSLQPCAKNQPLNSNNDKVMMILAILQKHKTRFGGFWSCTHDMHGREGLARCVRGTFANEFGTKHDAYSSHRTQSHEVGVSPATERACSSVGWPSPQCTQGSKPASTQRQSKRTPCTNEPSAILSRNLCSFVLAPTSLSSTAPSLLGR